MLLANSETYFSFDYRNVDAQKACEAHVLIYRMFYARNFLSQLANDSETS